MLDVFTHKRILPNLKIWKSRQNRTFFLAGMTWFESWKKWGSKISLHTPIKFTLFFLCTVACSFLSNLFSSNFFFFYLFYFPPFINLCCFFFSFPPVFSPCSLFQLFPSCFSFCLFCWGNSRSNRHGSSGMVWSQSADQTADQPCHKMGEPQ